jgi:hypothetical protein
MIKPYETKYKELLDSDSFCDDAVIFHGLEDCITGIDQNGYAVYDSIKIIDKFMQDGMTDEEAIEYMEYNVVGVNAGNGFVIHYH